MIRDGAKKKKALAQYAERIDPAHELTVTMKQEIEDIIEYLIDASGNQDGVYNDEDYVFKDGKKTTTLRGKKNKDVTSRLLVKDGKGEELKQKLLDFRSQILELVDEDDRATFAKEIPAIVDDATWKEKAATKSKNTQFDWATFNFKQMPVQAVLPIFRKFQNDVISTESTFLSYLANKVGTSTDVVLDKFTVVSSPDKTYVINGETFKTEVFMSASASAESNTGVSIKVNGLSLIHI